MTKYATLKKYQPYIDIIMKDLGLTGKVHIDFEFGTWRKMDGDAILYKTTSKDGKRYGKVRIDKTCDHGRILIVLLHELRHIYQFYTNRLVNDFWKQVRTRNGNIDWIEQKQWDGVLYDVHRPSNNPKKNDKYKNLPWEIDANRYQKEAKRLFPNNNLPAVNTYIGSIGNIKFYKTGKES